MKYTREEVLQYVQEEEVAFIHQIGRASCRERV